MDDDARRDPTMRFAEVVAVPEASVRLDEACFLIGAHAEPELDVATQLDALDELAAQCPEPTLDGVRALLFRDLGFDGERDDYYDPANSFLHRVVERRRGIPISLSVLMLEIGRRVGAPMAGIGMPGHFLVRDKVDPSVFVDPYHAGVILDRAGCIKVFDSLHDGRLAFDESFLDPIGPRAILARILANLKAIYLARRDRRALLWVQRLRAMLPDADRDEVRDLAAALAANGRLDEAASLLEDLADAADGTDLAAADQRLANALRARLN